nr:hypothetical protein [Glutamicibacter arilaitensis]
MGQGLCEERAAALAISGGDPAQVLGVAAGGRRQVGRGGCRARRPARAPLAQQQRHGPAVGDEMVRGDDQLMGR